MKVQFKLKNTKSNSTTSIQCFFYHQNTRFVYSLGEDRKIIPELWDDKLQRPIKGKTKENKAKIRAIQDLNPKSDITTELSNIETRIDNLIQEINTFSTNKEFNKQPLVLDELKDYLNGVFKKKQEEIIIQKKLDLNEYIEKFVHELNSGVRTFTTGSGERKKYAPSTAVAYQAFKILFDGYQKKLNMNLNFDDINMDIYHDFINYLTEQNLKNNTIGNKIKLLKAILSKSYDEGLHDNIDFKKREFKKFKSEVDNIFLTKEEVNKIFNLNLTSAPVLDLARDLFLCGCYTALRYSDYKKITPDNYITRDGKSYLHINTQKTNDKVIIPIKPELEKILKKYNYTLPKFDLDQINKNIKVVGKMAGIDEIVEIKELKGAIQTITKKPKYKLITSHTGRRTTATLLYLAGVSTLDIMMITGHKTEKSLLTYIKITKEETATRLMDNSFFSGSL